MANKNTIEKIITFLMFMFFSIWLGSYIVRNLLIFQFFEPENLSLRNELKNFDLSPVYYVIYPAIVTNLVSFLSFFIIFLIFIIITKIKLKENGWLLIIAFLIFITAPFEIYLLFKDYKIIVLIMDNFVNNSSQVLYLMKERMTLLNSFSLIEIFAYIFVIALTIFKPLQKKK
jgi:hypothetical protein